MTTRASHKARGSKFETDILKWLRENGYVAERLARAGKDDEGDVYFTHDGHYFVFECKAPGAGNAISLSGWITETQVEAANFAKARGVDPARVHPVLLIKARSKGLDQAYAVQPLSALMTHIKETTYH